MKIIPYLKLAVDKQASDLYFTAGAPAMIKVHGEHYPVGRNMLDAEQVKELIMELLTPEQQQVLQKHFEIDLATEAGGIGRFRVNVFHQRHKLGMVMRLIANKIPTVEELRVPLVLKELMEHRRGLILMVGATGSGKSSTLAAMVGHRNEIKGGHILTIEDPVEFSHPNKRAIVNQRELGLDTHSYMNALRSAVREAPDVVLIGECRDYDTMNACLQLAGTGHLVLTTLHASNTYQACQRMVRMFQADEREQLYMDLGLNLRAIVAQRLIKARTGGRVAAVEIMINTPYVAELIQQGKFEEIRQAMADSSDRNIQTFDDSLIQLYKDGIIEREEALANADSRSQLETKLDFGSTRGAA